MWLYWFGVAAGLLEEPQGDNMLEVSRPTHDAVARNRSTAYLSDVTAAVLSVAKSVLGFLPDAKQV